VQYATINNFKVLSTWYPRKDIQKGTWKIPGTNDVNQTDHIIVSERRATDIENVRTYRGANSDSDHFLVGARLKQKITFVIRNRTACRKRWNVEKFDETDVANKKYSGSSKKKITIQQLRRRTDTYKGNVNCISTIYIRRKT
jgi:hypothetical protein